MVHRGDFGGNMPRPSNPLAHFAPSFPAPTTSIVAQPSQAAFQVNQRLPFSGTPTWLGVRGHLNAYALAPPPAVAPQAFHPARRLSPWTAPQVAAPNANPVRRSSLAAEQPLHGRDLAARVAAINTLPPPPPPPPPSFQPNDDYTHSWPLSQPQPIPAHGYPALLPVGPSDAVVWGCWGQPVAPPRDAHFLQQPAVAVAPNGNNAGAPPAGTNTYGATSSSRAPPPVHQHHPAGGQTSLAPPAQRHGVPAAPPDFQSLEEFLMECGAIDECTVDKIFVEEFIRDMLQEEPVEQGRAEHEGLLPVGPRVGGWEQDQLGLYRHGVVSAVAGAVGGRGRDRAAAAEARERRSRRMAKRKASAKARADKLAAARGRQDGDQNQTEPSRD